MASLVVGLNSGTSMDGVDAVLLEISEDPDANLQFNQLCFLTEPYPQALKDELLQISREGSVQQICRYNVLLGKVFAAAALAVVRQARKGMEEVSLIGSHGQTIHHLPSPCRLHGYDVRSTLQIGDPSVIASECGVTTVGDFRMADVASGGQGAPIVPYLDGIVLHRHYLETGRVGVVVNIGGISNASAFVPDQKGSYDLIGFDCGPGNVLVDSLAKKWYGMEYDDSGNIAFSGQSSSVLLDRLMKDEFVCADLPKSTGREHYSMEYLEDVLQEASKLELSKEDCMATITEFTAAAISHHFDKYIRPHFKQDTTFDLFVCGGGVKNKFMMECLRRRLKDVEVCSSSKVGLDPDAREAILFAVLAYQTYRQRATSVPSVTGGREQLLQGKICPILRTPTN